jgi:hypothetical protein
MNNFKHFTVGACLGLACVGNAFAVVPSTLSDLNSWSVLGDVSATSSTARLTTASSSFEDDFPAAAGTFNISGTSAADNISSSLESFAGLTNGALGSDALEGSALKQTFNVNAGDTLSFGWKFLTNEGIQPDYAFVVINGVASTLVTTAAATIPSSSLLTWETVSGVFSHSFASASTVTLAVGVVDIGDYNVTSELRINDVALAPIPEPETYALLLAGLGLLGAVSRRRAKAA